MILAIELKRAPTYPQILELIQIGRTIEGGVMPQDPVLHQTAIPPISCLQFGANVL